MKNLFLLMLVVFAAAGCEGPTGPMGPPGEPGTQLDIYVNDYVIKQNQWERTFSPDGFVTYSCLVEEKNLNENFYLEGTVTGSLYFSYNTAEETKTPLPYQEELIDNNLQAYREIYTFQYMPGAILFLIQTKSYAPLPPPNESVFQIQMIY